MAKMIKKLYIRSELTAIDIEIQPLKLLAAQELASIYGLTGMVYTPHIDAYMLVCVKKAEILACLKRQGILPFSEVELISAKLESEFKRTKHNVIVEYKGKEYKRKLSPLKLSKSGKVVHKWARYWLLQTPNGIAEPNWEEQVRELWPTYFLIRTNDFQ